MTTEEMYEFDKTGKLKNNLLVILKKIIMSKLQNNL